MSDSDLRSLGADVADPDSDAAARVELSPASGRLGELARWLAGTGAHLPLRQPGRVRLLQVASDADGADALDSLAADAGVAVWSVPPNRFGDGIAAADRAIDSGAALLLVTGRGGADACALAASAITLAEPVAVLPRGAAAIDTKAWIDRAVLLRDRRPQLLPLRALPDRLLQALADPSLSTACGLIARAAARRTPLLLDGELAVAAALVAAHAQSAFTAWWRVADTSSSAVQAKALIEFDQRPVLDLGVESADGTAALLALAALRSAAALAAPAAAGGAA
jgi:nicotinate-nucleotide--dimethylbenzimidazole phosphoribosyltransferase